MQKSLFVAGLDWSITSEELQAIFAPHGTVESAKVITDKFTGQSKGFGFVDMASVEEAQNCITQLNNSTQKNRQIVVKIKEPKPAGSTGGAGGGFRSNSSPTRRSW